MHSHHKGNMLPILSIQWNREDTNVAIVWYLLKALFGEKLGVLN